MVRSISAPGCRNRFNVSVAEVGGQDTWQRAVLGLSAAGSEAERVRIALERVIDFIEDLHLAEVRGSDVQVLGLPQEDPTQYEGEEAPLPWEGVEPRDEG